VLAYGQVASRTGAEVSVVPNDEHGQLDEAALARMASARARLIGVSHMPTSGGLVQHDMARFMDFHDDLKLLSSGG
jgi:selenocysteine lyase/cysteine desulfurase